MLKEDLSDQTAVGFNSIEKKFKPFKIGGVYFVTLTTKDDVGYAEDYRQRVRNG